MTDSKSLYTLIGGVVDSRLASDRTRLQRDLRSALKSFSMNPPPGIEMKRNLETTVGDEFQGVFSDMADAVLASLLIRLELLRSAGIDSRYGLGFGEVKVFDESRSPVQQDGSGWWSAREAIAEAAAQAESHQSDFIRTRFRCDPKSPKVSGEEMSAVNAFLVTRDAMVDEMKPKTQRMLQGLLLGNSQSTIARDEGVTQSAVSQALQRSGAHAIALAHRQFERGEP